MKHTSLWLDGIKAIKEPILKENIKCDVLIIGAGISGISTAYHLRGHNLNTVVVDKNEIGHGITSRTTGKITYLQETIYSELKNKYSKEIAKKYLYSQKDAIELFTSFVKKHHIDCNLDRVSSYVFSSKKSQIEKIKEEKKLLEEFKIEVEKTTFEKKYAIKVDDTYVFHPLKYILKLKEICKEDGIKFYEHTDINYLKKDDNYYICGNELVEIRAKKVVFACHYPYFLFPFLMPLKCTLEKSYIGVAPILEIKSYSGISAGKPTISIRYLKDKENYMFYLSDSHFLSEELDFKKHFEHIMKAFYKMNLKPKYLWSNHDIITFDKLPFIGKLEANSSLFLETGYNTWGMTNGSLAGKIIADMILDIYNPYESLFSPLRKLKISALPNNIYSNAKSMIDSKVDKNKNWYPDNVYFHDNLATYVDKFGKEHTVYNICPHLKCSLLFNEVEKTWDCPCHGSRFDLDGKVIIGPSNYSITCKQKKDLL